MSIRGPLATIVVCATSMLALPTRADTPTQQAPAAVTVSCSVYEIWASHGKGTIDAKLPKQLGHRLTNTLKQNDFKLLSHSQTTLATKKPQTLKLGKGTATITLVETVNKAQARLTVDFMAANKLKSSATQLVSAGDWVVTSANQSNAANADAHVLAVGSCK